MFRIFKIFLVVTWLMTPCFASEKSNVSEVPKATKILQEEQQKCAQEVGAVLKKYGFKIIITPEITINGQKLGVVLVPIQ